jgi:hypothetical protein
MEGSKFKEIVTDHVDDNGAVYMDGYKTQSPDEEGVVYSPDAKPRLEFTNGSPLEVKLSLIEAGVKKIVDLL